MRLKDRVAIVTGAARGIGNAVVRGLAHEGAKVILSYYEHADVAEATIREIEAGGGEAAAIYTDVTDSAQVERMVQSTVEHFGRVDILVNNAGIYPRKTWHEITEAEWDAVLNVNLKGCFLCAKAVYPFMKRQGYGRIINVSSVTFWGGAEGLAHYVAAKGGIIGFTRTIARESSQDGITINAITPGAIQTETELEMFPDRQEEFAQTFAAMQSIPRRLVSKDMVGICVFLASEDSAAITGQTINVDGGWMMH